VKWKQYPAAYKRLNSFEKQVEGNFVHKKFCSISGGNHFVHYIDKSWA